MSVRRAVPSPSPSWSRARAAATLLLCLTACRGEESGHPAVRILDLVPVDAGFRSDSDFDWQTLDAVATGVPHLFRVSLSAPPGATLKLAVAVTGAHPAPVTFEVQWQPSGGDTAQSVFQREVHGGEQDLWHEASIPLPPSVTGEGSLVFRTSSSVRAAVPRLAHWGAPILLPARPETRDPSRHGVVLVLLDTLRADHVGCYGYERPTTPRLDALAARGTVYLDASALAPWTLPSTMSILTSTTPIVHTVRRTDRRLPETVTTLAEVLSRQGYLTAGFTEGGYVSSFYGFSRGFDRYVSDGTRNDARATFGMASRWIQEHGHHPYFVLIQTYQPHTPYDPPVEHLQEINASSPPGDVHPFVRESYYPKSPEWGEEARERPLTHEDLEHVVRLYDAEIRYTDSCVGEFLEAFGDDDGTQPLVLVSSDHGEDFYDHQAFAAHRNSLYQELLHVPLIIAGPGVPQGLEVKTPVSLLDVAPTILDWLGLDGEDDFQGRSLMEPLESGATSPVFGDRHFDGSSNQYSLRRGDLKLVVGDGAADWAVRQYKTQREAILGSTGLDVGVYEARRTDPVADVMLFDLADDPAETTNLAEARPGTVASMREELDALMQMLRARAAVPEAYNIDPRLREQLKELGYLR